MNKHQRTKKNNTPYVSHSAAGSEEEDYEQYSCSSVGVFSATPTSTILLQEEEEINKGGLLGLVGAQKRKLPGTTLPAESPRRFTNDIRGGGGGATISTPSTTFKERNSYKRRFRIL
jgi:hypothetical protein